MKNIKKTMALIVAVCMMIGSFTGCTSTAEGKALYDAMVKTQNIKSGQYDMKFTARLDATGLSEQEQAQFNQIKAMVNGATMTMNMKQVANEELTASKAEADVDMMLGGMSMKMGVWVDMDLNGSSPKFKEIIKLPEMLTAMDPSMAGKVYMVMDFNELFNAPEMKDQAQNINFADTMKFTKEFQAKTTEFMSKYLAQYDPGFTFITDAGVKDIVTPERTVKAHVYQIKLDDKAAKKLIRYTVNNFADSKDAMDFAVEYMKLVSKFTVPTPGVSSPTAQLEKAMADFEKQKPALLAGFNKAMDQIEDIKLVGDKGITLEYAVDENGYIVSQSGNMDFVIDAAKLGSIGKQPISQMAGSGVYNIGLDFSMLSYNLNKDITVEMPTVTAANSINYMDMLKRTEPVAPAIPTITVSKKTTKAVNNVTYLPARDTIKLIKGASYSFKSGAGAATIKIDGNTFVVTPGKAAMKVNGKEFVLQSTAGKIIDGKFYLNTEFMEVLGYNVILK